MGRKASVWRRGENGAYYTTYQGEQLRLSEDKAERLFHELHAKKPPKETVGRPSVGKVCDLFLDNSERRHDPDTFKQYKSKLNRFCAHVGKATRVADLKPHHVTSWCGFCRGWSESTRAAGIACVLACLNWAVEEGHLESHPLVNVKRGRYERRERILTPDERDRLFGAVKDPGFKTYLRFLELTGCRPFSEASRITAADCDLGAGTVTLQKHKTRKKTNRSRVIFLCPEARQTVGALCVLFPEGAIFRNSISGEPWSKQAVQKRFHKLTRRLGLSGVSAYCLRHGFITQALERGLTVEVVAELVGNSPATIYKHYNHVGQKQEMLKAAAARAVG